MPRFIHHKKQTHVHRFTKTQPSLIGEVFEARVRDVATSGKAVVEHASGIPIFVAGAWQDEKVRIKITACKKQYGQGELLEVLEPHPQRIAPLCEHFTASPACGGCAWQFMEYAAQLALKQQWVKTAVDRMANKQKTVKAVKQLQAALVPIQASEKIWAYRNRAEFKSDGEKLGFQSSGSHELVDVTHCPVLEPAVADHLASLRGHLPNRSWQTHKKQPVNKKQPAKHKQSGYTLIAADSSMATADIRINQRLDFKQTNDGQNQFLQQWLSHILAGCDQQAPLLELFAGAGNFTEVIAQHNFKEVIAAELSPEAINTLNAKQLAGVTGVVANLFDAHGLQVLCAQHANARTLVLDPPREGLVVIEPLLALKKLHTVAYISCDLASCMRDLERFVAAGFEIVNVQPVDMFPQTPHIELCVHLQRV